MLYVPAHRPAMLAKTQSIPADFFVVDLEDGVAPAEKSAARDNVREAAGKGRLPHDRWGLRVNHDGSKWFEDDMQLAEEVKPPAVVLPKAEDPVVVASVAGRVTGDDCAIALMIETALGVGRARELAAADGSVNALFYGAADLERSLGARPGADRTWERHAMSEIVLAARMAVCAAIDAVTFAYRNEEKLESDARVARELGFDGKGCIHPAQIETIHRVFSSTSDEVEWAERVLREWKTQDGERAGVVVIGHEMIEGVHVEIARRILARRA
ncbi:MAG: CoA ester lyase [Gemmatimonadetes bacterium]|nr:CoA ester lyase [Gemmatimonadota bacterium]